MFELKSFSKSTKIQRSRCDSLSLICYSGEDNEKAGQDTSDGLEKNNSQNNLVTALCQTFNSFNSSNHKRIFPKLVKEFISRVRYAACTHNMCAVYLCSVFCVIKVAK